MSLSLSLFLGDGARVSLSRTRAHIYIGRRKTKIRRIEIRSRGRGKTDAPESPSCLPRPMLRAANSFSYHFFFLFFTICYNMFRTFFLLAIIGVCCSNTAVDAGSRNFSFDFALGYSTRVRACVRHLHIFVVYTVVLCITHRKRFPR